MAEYQLTKSDVHVIRAVDQAMIPDDPGNTDWIAYQEWLAAGGVPDPLPLPVPINPALDTKPAKTAAQILGV